MSNYALSGTRLLLRKTSHFFYSNPIHGPRLTTSISQRCFLPSHNQPLSSPLAVLQCQQLHTSPLPFYRKKATEPVNKEDPALPTYNEFQPFILIPNPFRVLQNWLTIWELKTTWDPSFDVNEFKRGAVQALITVVELVRSGDWKKLRGLLDKNILDSVSTPDSALSLLSQSTNDGLNISHSNIQHVRIQNVRVHQIVEHKFCDFFVDIIAFRREKEKMRDVGYLFQMKFHRNYTFGVLPTWTITGLNFVVSCKEWPTQD